MSSLACRRNVWRYYLSRCFLSSVRYQFLPESSRTTLSIPPVPKAEDGPLSEAADLPTRAPKSARNKDDGIAKAVRGGGGNPGVFVYPIPPEMDESELRKIAEKCGPVRQIRMGPPTDRTRQAYVLFHSPRSAAQLKDTHGADAFTVRFARPRLQRGKNGEHVSAKNGERSNAKNGEHASAGDAPTNCLYVSNLAFDASPAAVRKGLMDTFGKWGELWRLAVGMNAPGKHAGFAHLYFRSPWDAHAVLCAHRVHPFHGANRALWMGFGAGMPPPQPRKELYVAPVREAATRDSGLTAAVLDGAQEGLDGMSVWDVGGGRRAARLTYKSIDDAAAALRALDGAMLPTGDLLDVTFLADRDERGARPSKLDTAESESARDGDELMARLHGAVEKASRLRRGVGKKAYGSDWGGTR
ncbi:hypothetical protein GLOTRDRAFT_128941 [Gloeophyllum trabeum ATCC 11539]|uniref:RRM domain-containing protein n=1 Tax=Gloeophyllum trabeum (strain ATCC 11539 / FP-39264 / Madison 617) TaxID=670483 RepID=S7Q9Q9_GLOTA|nr:uncharacterized protein GLOTRDRAFT_128941 [Gloeophyllum trabeum ATCC 11539]EPQ56073.1 hypothetical protein GLOTRDRAFT_128941 [Gloeophyllum trabeum ATCC 11539]